MLGLGTANGTISSLEKRLAWYDLAVIISLAFGAASTWVGMDNVVQGDGFQSFLYQLAAVAIIVAFGSFIVINAFSILRHVTGNLEKFGIGFSLLMVTGAEISARIFAVIHQGWNDSTIILTIVTVLFAIGPIAAAPAVTMIAVKARERGPKEREDEIKSTVYTQAISALGNSYRAKIKEMENNHDEVIATFGHLMPLNEIVSPKTSQLLLQIQPAAEKTTITEEKQIELPKKVVTQNIETNLEVKPTKPLVKSIKERQQETEPINLSEVRRGRGRPPGAKNKKTLAQEAMQDAMGV
jgi:hypothetical protein